MSCRRISMQKRRAALAACASAMIVGGCASDAAVAPPPVTDGAQLYWALTLDYHAVTLSTVAPYDTIRLTATSRTAMGDPLPALPAATFTSLDLDHAQVSADGLVRVIKSGSQIPVVATLVVGNLRHADTVFITATNAAPPPVLAALSIHPGVGDSAKTANAKTFEAQAFDADSVPITGLSVYYTTTDPTIASIDRVSGSLSPLRPGHLVVIATGTAYGVTKADTLPFTIGYPVLAFLTIRAESNASGQTVAGFPPSPIMVGPGATVLISNPTSLATDLTFDDPTNVQGGNVEALTAANGFPGIAFRRFPVAGTYPFHSTTFGTSGTIIVVDESTSNP